MMQLFDSKDDLPDTLWKRESWSKKQPYSGPYLPTESFFTLTHDSHSHCLRNGTLTCIKVSTTCASVKSEIPKANKN